MTQTESLLPAIGFIINPQSSVLAGIQVTTTICHPGIGYMGVVLLQKDDLPTSFLRRFSCHSRADGNPEK